MLPEALIDYLPSPDDASGPWKDISQKAGIRYGCNDAPLTALTNCRRKIRNPIPQPDSLINIQADVPFAEFARLSDHLRSFQCGTPFVQYSTFAPVPYAVTGRVEKKQ